MLCRKITPRLESFVTEKIEQWLGLKINRDKTRIYEVKASESGLDFLGFNFQLAPSPHGPKRRYVSWLGQLRHRTVEETLSRSRLPQGVVPIEVWRLPAAEPLGIEHGPVAQIVVAHPGQGFGEPSLR
jgi:hypothetical protein